MLLTIMKFSPQLTQFIGVVNKAIIICKIVNLACKFGNIIYIDNMTISKEKIKLLKNTHLEDTMSNLDKLLKEVNGVGIPSRPPFSSRLVLRASQSFKRSKD